MAMASKRVFNLTEGNTPGKPGAKKTTNEATKTTRKSLFGDGEGGVLKKSVNPSWSRKEDAAVVQYICLYWTDAYSNKWPMVRDPGFWDACAAAVNKVCNSSRTGTSCRTRVSKVLSKKYATTEDAELDLDIDYISNDVYHDANAIHPTGTPLNKIDITDSLSPVFLCSPSKNVTSLLLGDTVKNLLDAFRNIMSERLKKQLVQYLYKLLLLEAGGMPLFKFVKSDFLDVSLGAMETLLSEGKHNLIHGLSQCFNRTSSSTETRMPLNQMPFGLIDYNIRFFSSHSTQKLGMEHHYARWTETMFAHFGHKWLSLHRGPCWQYEVEESTSSKSSLIADALELSGIDFLPQEPDAIISQDGEDKDYSSLGTTHQDVDAATNSNVQSPESTPSSFANSPEEGRDINTSTLWTHLTNSDANDIIQGQVSPKTMENHHGIQPNTQQQQQESQKSLLYDPLKSKTNIASLGVRQIQKRITLAGFTRTVDVQMEALKQAKESNPKGRWWIKGDACDVRKGLRESMRGQWAGDEDMGSGTLKKLFEEYKERCGKIKSLGSEGRWNFLLDDLAKLQNLFQLDAVFLLDGKEAAKKAYQKALGGSRVSESSQMELAWDVTGFEELLKQAKQFLKEVLEMLEEYKCGKLDKVKDILVVFKTNALKYLQGFFTKKRSAASHLLVFLISDELRNHKPYAVPVRFLSYSSITDGKMRELEIELEDAMKSIGMVVVGFTTDGEFNSLRTMGRKRAISVIEIAKNAKNLARKTKVSSITNYLTLDRYGNPISLHPAIPVDDVIWLDDFMKNGGNEPISFEAAIIMLRRKLFPFCYDPYGWVQGRAETRAEVLKSVMAIYMYRMEVNNLKNHPSDPADFSSHLYQPERDDKTSEFIHHREDHNHLLKRIVTCLRDGLIPGIDMRHMRDALHDPTTGVTYEALTGKNKQSVPDCETLISPGVITFLERHGHTSSARVIKLLHNWHKAVDGRGLSEAERSTYCRNMKEWLLDTWFPWQRGIQDYILLDVNRPLKGICGLTREVVVGLVANLESREQRRQEYVSRNLPPEHPRASSTDDVEGFIGLLHEMLGASFDLKQFYSELPKILNEFNKRIDPHLPFFYWTGAKQRYREFDLPSFNQPSGEGIVERLDRVHNSRRGDPGVFVPDRASLPQRGQLTARAQFHKAPVALPPVQCPPQP